MIPGDAFVSLDDLDGPFDLVFLDAWKDDYEALFQLARAPARAGRRSWSPTTSSRTLSLAEYSAARQADPGLVSVTVPLDNGLEVTTVLTGGLLSD